DRARVCRHLYPRAHADPGPAPPGPLRREVRARRPLLHAPALRLARARRALLRPARARHGARARADDADRRLPRARQVIAMPPAFAWTSGELHGDVLLGAGLLAVAYAGAWARGPRRHAGEPLWFFAGLGVLLLALNGPLHDLSDYYLFSAHMVQHLLLTLVVAPLLLAGTPAFMLDRLLGPLLRSALERFAVRATTRAVPALALYAVALIGRHLPLPYDQALERHGRHVVEPPALLA